MRLKKRGGMAAAGRILHSAAKTGPQAPEANTRRDSSAEAHSAEPQGARNAATPRLIRRQDYAPAFPAGRNDSVKAPNTGLAYAAVTPLMPRRGLPVRPRLVVIIASAAVLTAAILTATTLLMPRTALASGEEVLYGGRMLCIAENRDVALQAMRQLETDLQATYGMGIQADEELTFAPVACDSQNILGAEGVKQALKNNVEVQVLASVITVNGRPAVALKTAEEAQQALDSILQPFLSVPAERNRTDVSFVETVQVQQMPIDYTLVQGSADAVRVLTSGSNVEDNLYTVEKGDSLAKIAKKFSLKVSDIRKANPKLASSDVIQVGQTLNIIQPSNWLNVKYTETVTREEALPFETVEQPDATMYTTQKKVTQEGVNGQREVTAKVTYVNGMEAQKEILNQTVKVPAQNEIVLRGTKKVPTNSGNTSVSGKYICPLRDYRISSTFGTRTLDGVTKTHYGVDMAAPKGTPIYAAAAGTVIYSGSASGYGLVVYIDHGNGVVTRYGHCSKLLVKKGQSVERGKIIALVGSTGHSTGPHLHFEMRVNGKAVDPRKHVKI